MSKDIHSLSHTRWNCKYHVVFAPKYRRKVFYGEKRLEIGAILRELCNCVNVNIKMYKKWKIKMYNLGSTIHQLSYHQ